ncbi:MAG: UDP-2,3-diacylglucosamine diphosphatase [Gammaproteobacteria bacterium]
MTTLFISDLHIEPGQPRVIQQLLNFLKTEAVNADALYILGDLFESWVGDDDPEPEKHKIISALHVLSKEERVPCYFMRGNRDFLAGEVFADRSGCEILPDPTVIDIFGQPVLLMHGDTLCTDDTEYQTFRALVRDPMWQQEFLGTPLDHRQAMAAKARDASRTHTSEKPQEIMDVNDDTVRKSMTAHGVRTMIHGHTHRPAIHEFKLGGRPARRIVLGDWHSQGSVLRWSAKGLELAALPR